ncbi:MAG: hypothetical protein FWC67_04920, partial [Defluviitaleaceae bacterium]|nr:hypothetical protein [Defluviitaleaceae bacterium]
MPSPNKKAATITARLVTSFVLIIVVFVAYVIISMTTAAYSDRLHRHNNDFVMARTEMTLEFHQEFTEMRRLARESFLSHEWRIAVDLDEWLYFEQKLSTTFSRLENLANDYKASVRADQFLSSDEGDERVYLMTEVMGYISVIYAVFSDNFFQGSNENFHQGYVAEYAQLAEALLREMRNLSSIDQAANLANIERFSSIMSILSAILIVLAATFAGLLAFSSVRAFTKKVKAIEANAMLIERGDFSATQTSGRTDEMSMVFSKMATNFVDLISEITHVAHENKTGEMNVRINEESLEGGYKEAANAINALLDTVAAEKERNERMMFMFDFMPLMTTIIDKNLNVVDCNTETLRSLGIDDKQKYIDNFEDYFMKPMEKIGYSVDMVRQSLRDAFDVGHITFEWVLKDASGRELDVEIMGISSIFRGEWVLVTYIRDISRIKESQIREQETNERMQRMFEATPIL